MNRPVVDWRAPTQPIFDQTPTQPFRLVAPLEQRVEALEAENAAFREDQQSLCDLLADKCRRIALLEQELAQIKTKQSRSQYSVVAGKVPAGFMTEEVLLNASAVNALNARVSAMPRVKP